ncbi:hypothetical protein BJX61DRAFT_542577 [Aspergillus egyptiacus]|nr:hypothetical protein BJX61DRAFT_542577 [Aspergillus egyptiacus]
MSSDDEDYFDEFDDDGIFWVEESEPTAADDLAATATYDPTFLDDPSLETADLFSDWDELTDDYYDEDPTVVRRLRAIGAWPIKEAAHINAPPAKRRKVKGTPLDYKPIFQGVAWRQPEDEEDVVEIYAPGEGEKVSLLKDWREIFRNAKPSIGRIRARKPVPRAPDNVLEEESEVGPEAPSLAEKTGEGYEVSAVDSGSEKPLRAASVHTRVVDSPSELPSHPKNDELSSLNKDEAKRPLEFTTEDQIAIPQTVSTDALAEKKVKESTTAQPRRGRKRKASVSVDGKSNESEDTTGNATQHQSKRPALSKAPQSVKPTPGPSGPVRRSARHKK